MVVRPAPRRAVTRDEAAEIALEYVAAQGYRAQVQRVERNDADWRVKLRAVPPYAGEVRVDVGPGGAVLGEHGRFARRHREGDDDEDDDRDDEGRGRHRG